MTLPPVKGLALRVYWGSLLTLVALLHSSGIGCGEAALSVEIDSPAHGEFIVGTSVTVTGTSFAAGNASSFDVNGVPVTDVSAGGGWSVEVPVDPAAVFNPIVVTVSSGSVTQNDRVTVVVGDGVASGFVADGDVTPDGVGLRLGNAGLAQIAPVVESLSGDSLDISAIVTAQNPIATGNFGGIVDYTANAVEVGFSGFGLTAVAGTGGIDATVSIDDFYIELDLDLSWLGSCTLEVMTASTTIGGLYDLQPLASDPSLVDVNLTSTPSVVLGGFSSQYVSGVCDDPIIGDIINLIIGQNQIQSLMQSGFESNLADPDGAGPLDAPIAAAIEQSLASISIAGPVGDALGGSVLAPIASITEDAGGLTISADAAITSSGVVPGAPDLTASYAVSQTPPAWPATTPVGGVPYGMAFGISTSALNQLLKTQIEGGLLRQDVTTFELAPGFTVPLTAGLLADLMPELSAYPASAPVTVRVIPTLAPVFTGQQGSSGELAQLKIGGLVVEMFLTNSNEPLLELEVGMEVGVDIFLLASGLNFALGSVVPGSIYVGVTQNPLMTDEANVESAMIGLFPSFVPALQGGLDAFPLPAFLGLDLVPLEVSRLPGGYLGVFADLALAPTTTIQNFTITDLSTGDYRSGGGCWIHEWRHRVSGRAIGNRVSANLKGMLGSDAGCTTNDNTRTATPSYRLVFDVVSVPNETWSIDIDHSLLGAFTRISDGYNDGFGFQDGGGTMRFDSNVRGSYTFLAGGSGAGAFDFVPSVTSDSDGIGGSSSNRTVEFTGTNGVTLAGTGDATIQLDFSFDLYSKSNSNTAFPTANGDEQAIRFGKNDTIDTNFTAGGYPGMGSRNIAEDGHAVVVDLVATPLP